MRERLLGAAEVTAWIAASFTVFLGLRVAAVLLNLLNPAQCDEVCGLGPQTLPLALLTYGLTWCPFVLVHFVRLARRGSGNWFFLHTVIVVLAHAVAMLLVIRIFVQYGDADTRTSILATCVAVFEVLTGLVLFVGGALRSQAPAS